MELNYLEITYEKSAVINEHQQGSLTDQLSLYVSLALLLGLKHGAYFSDDKNIKKQLSWAISPLLDQWLFFSHTPPSRRNREECTSSPLNTAVAAPLGSHIPIRPSAHSQKNAVWGGGMKQDRGQRGERVWGKTLRARQKKGKTSRQRI